MSDKEIRAEDVRRILQDRGIITSEDTDVMGTLAQNGSIKLYIQGEVNVMPVVLKNPDIYDMLGAFSRWFKKYQDDNHIKADINFQIIRIIKEDACPKCGGELDKDMEGNRFCQCGWSDEK